MTIHISGPICVTSTTLPTAVTDTDKVEKAVERLREDIAGGGTAFEELHADLRTVLSGLERMEGLLDQCKAHNDSIDMLRAQIDRHLKDYDALMKVTLRSAPPLMMHDPTNGPYVPKRNPSAPPLFTEAEAVDLRELADAIEAESQPVTADWLRDLASRLSGVIRDE